MEREGLARVKMFVVITVAYLIFWGPLFLVTLFSYGDYKTETPSTSHEVMLQQHFTSCFFLPLYFAQGPQVQVWVLQVPHEHQEVIGTRPINPHYTRFRRTKRDPLGPAEVSSPYYLNIA